MLQNFFIYGINIWKQILPLLIPIWLEFQPYFKIITLVYF